MFKTRQHIKPQEMQEPIKRKSLATAQIPALLAVSLLVLNNKSSDKMHILIQLYKKSSNYGR